MGYGLFALRISRGQQKSQIQELRALLYKTQSANFTAGLKVTGGTSGATGYIVTDTDGGTTGTLLLDRVRGTFVADEAITDSGTGAAVVNGTLAFPTIPTPDDQVALLIDAVDMSKADALDCVRKLEQKIIEMPWPSG